MYSFIVAFATIGSIFFIFNEKDPGKRNIKLEYFGQVFFFVLGAMLIRWLFEVW